MLIGYEKPVFTLLAQVKMVEHTAQSSDLYTGVAVDLRIKTIIAAQPINGNGMSGQWRGFLSQFMVDQKPQKLAHCRRAGKFRTAQEPVALQTKLKLLCFG